MKDIKNPDSYKIWRWILVFFLRLNLHLTLAPRLGIFPRSRPKSKTEIKGLPVTICRVMINTTNLSDGALKVKVSRETLEYKAEHGCYFLCPLAVGGLCLAAAFFTLGFNFL